jgi:hypothetical protein
MRLIFTPILCLFISLLLWTCQDIEDASPAKRKTFIKLYEPPYDITATDFERVPDGYVVLGNMSVPPDGNAVDSIVTVVFKIDNDGNQVGGFQYYYGGSGKSIKHHPAGGYIIVGDRIKRNLNPDDVANGLISSARILVLDEALQQQYVTYRSDESGNTIKADFYGGTLTIMDNQNNDVIVLGTYVEGVVGQLNQPEKPFIVSFTKNGDYTLSENWNQNYDLIDRNYKNARSIHVNSNNNIIWATSIARIQNDATFSYVSIPYVESNSQFLNASTIGETQDQLFIASDIQPTKFAGFGYGVVGSYSEPAAVDGSKSNMFFLKVAENGSIVSGSERFFDAILSENNTPLEANTVSSIVDEGLALATTTDGGFVLAGSMQTTPAKGNGEKDIYLVKLNILGDMLWNKTIGGTGDEVVAAIKEADDGGLLILGTNTLGRASSVFLIKTDKNGELKN